MSNSIGFRTPFTTENHVLIERRLWFERWPEVQLAILHVRTQAVDENHRNNIQMKVTSILTLHEKRVFFIIPNCQWFGSFLDLPPTQNAIVANKGLGWDFPNPSRIPISKWLGSFISHEWPFGRVPTTLSLGDSNDHHGFEPYSK